MLEIPVEAYEKIVKQVNLTSGEKKLDFLFRYVPKIRKAGRNMIEEFEVLFVKEVLTQGYVIQKQDDQDDYFYFVYSGKCRILYSTAKDSFFGDLSADPNKKQLVLGYLKRGEYFGE